jgi:hypothetical protein
MAIGRMVCDVAKPKYLIRILFQHKSVHQKTHTNCRRSNPEPRNQWQVLIKNAQWVCTKPMKNPSVVRTHNMWGRTQVLVILIVASRRLDLVRSMRATMRPGTELIPPSRHTSIEVRPVCQQYDQDSITFVLGLYLTDSPANKCVSILIFVLFITIGRWLTK